MIVLSIDTGTTESAYAVMNYHKQERLVEFGKIHNDAMIDKIINLSSKINFVCYEEFASYGMPIGQTTMKSIWWNGYFCAICEKSNLPFYPVLRKDVKMHICQTMKAKDANIRQAIIDKYGEPGTKKNPGMLYGASKDVWSAIAINLTFNDQKNELYKEGMK